MIYTEWLRIVSYKSNLFKLSRKKISKFVFRLNIKGFLTVDLRPFNISPTPRKFRKSKVIKNESQAIKNENKNIDVGLFFLVSKYSNSASSLLGRVVVFYKLSLSTFCYTIYLGWLFCVRARNWMHTIGFHNLS